MPRAAVRFDVTEHEWVLFRPWGLLSTQRCWEPQSQPNRRIRLPGLSNNLRVFYPAVGSGPSGVLSALMFTLSALCRSTRLCSQHEIIAIVRHTGTVSRFTAGCPLVCVLPWQHGALNPAVAFIRAVFIVGTKINSSCVCVCVGKYLVSCRHTNEHLWAKPDKPANPVGVLWACPLDPWCRIAAQ